MATWFWRRLVLGALLIMLATGSAACRRSEPPPSPEKHEDELVVFAAASLREAFSSMGDAFEKAHPKVEVTFNFAGSQELRTQLEHGAPADVFASADHRHMNELAKAKQVRSPVVFARNEPVLIVTKEQAATLPAFADLPNARRIVIGVVDVPIGKYTLQILDKASKSLGSDFRARVEARVVSRELNVRQVLAKVTLGEADAAIVYRTDARTAKDRVLVVTIPPELNVIAEYPIAAVEGAPHPALARAWMDLARSEQGQRILADMGFMPHERLTQAP